jgi:hypothetical protein
MQESNETKMLKKIIERGYYKTKKYEYMLNGTCVLWRKIGSETWREWFFNVFSYLGIKQD